MEKVVKRASLFCIYLLALVAVSQAGEIYIGNTQPNTGRKNSWPFNTQFGTEWRYQLVLTAKNMGNKPANIVELAFAPTSSGTFTASTFEVRMSHTTVPATSTFANNLPNPKVVLISNTYSWAPVGNQWSPIGLTSSFAYNGTDDLTIELRYKGGAKGGGFGGVCYFAGSTHHRIYNRAAGSYTAPTGSMDFNGNNIRLTTADATLTLSGSGKPGTTVTLDLAAASDAGKPYQVGSSLGTGPIPIGQRQIGLKLDDMLVVSVGGLLPMIFVNYTGLLDGSGKAQASIVIPSIPALTGVRVHSAFVTFVATAPQGVSLISPTATLTIQ